MRRISEIICESIRACYEMCKKEHDKMDEFILDNPDFKKITELDFLTRKNNETRHETWNELNETLFKIIKEKKYDWESLEKKDWDNLRSWENLGVKNGSL
jgi:hypothetical protein